MRKIKEVVQEYFSHEGYSRTDIVNVLKGPLVYENAQQDENLITPVYYMKGSLFEFLAFGPQDEFYETYSIFRLEDDQYPSDTLKLIIDTVYNQVVSESQIDLGGFIMPGNNTVSINMETYAQKLLEVASSPDINYGKGKFKDETILKKLFAYKDYWEQKVRSIGKSIIKNDMYEHIKNMVDDLKTSEKTSWLFDRKDKMILFQVPVYTKIRFKHKGSVSPEVPVKILLDLVIIDTKAKTITPIDIKTTRRQTHNFKYDYLKHHYYLQASFYYDVLKSYWFKISDERVVEFGGIHIHNPNTYTIQPFMFLVSSTNEDLGYSSPLLFTVSDELLQAGAKGFNLQGRDYPGYLQGLDDILHHEYTNNWLYPHNVENITLLTKDNLM